MPRVQAGTVPIDTWRRCDLTVPDGQNDTAPLWLAYYAARRVDAQ
jgi:hypothetical protein